MGMRDRGGPRSWTRQGSGLHRPEPWRVQLRPSGSEAWRVQQRQTAHPAWWIDATTIASSSIDPKAASGVASTDEGRVEGVLLIAKSPVSLHRLAKLAGLPDATRARTLVRTINETYRRDGRGLTIETVAGGVRMMSHPSVAPWLGRLGYLPVPVKLSGPMLETLAVVAYREPVTRADVESVRGLACGEILRQLLSVDLIRIAGRSEELGRPYRYATTTKFLKIFGLPSLSALPPIDAGSPLGDSSLPPTSPPDPLPSTPSGSPENPMPTLLEPMTNSPALAVASPRRRKRPGDSRRSGSIGPVAIGPAAIIEDEEDDLYEKGPDVDDDDLEDDDDWEDDDTDTGSDDEEEEDDDVEEDEADEDEAEEDEGWQEVSDDDSEEDWGDDDDEEDDDDDDWDDAAEDDEDWTE